MVVPISSQLSLALNMASNPGAYALLIGSGVSRGAQIPTGWEVVLDLVKRIAENEGEDPGSDPAEWYSTRFGVPPRYSSILEELAPSPAERQSLLRHYFEATAEEREEGTKTPTAAHHAIARLVRDRWIRVILTTNFDRLLESALDTAGITPVIISSADQALGATPIAHTDCTILKVHGDYLDTRIRNSEDELRKYEEAVESLLGQILDQYGLVVCGWSAEHDTALRTAIERRVSRRYTMYWCCRTTPGFVAQGLINLQSALTVEITDADRFFVELEETVTGVDRSGTRHPLEAAAAIETLKRYLPEASHRIRLRELVRDVTEDRIASLTVDIFPTDNQVPNEEMAARTERLHNISEAPVMLAANGCYWGEPKHDAIWLGLIRRLAELEVPASIATRWRGLFHYPALVCLYAAGIAALVAQRCDLLKSLLLMPVYSSRDRTRHEMVTSVYLHNVLPEYVGHMIFSHPDAPKTHYRTPSSRFLYRALRAPFNDIIPSDEDYTDAFDRYEYIVSLVHADVYSQRGRGVAFPGGCFFWRVDRSGRNLSQVITDEISKVGDQWPPLQAGFFDGSLDRLSVVKQQVDGTAARHRF